jgi:5-(carboxyamino)imidazole ribonucleotide synthase
MDGARARLPLSLNGRSAMTEVILPGMTVGILGGGQLGRMLACAAAKIGLSTHIYCPDRDSPAFAVAASRTIAPYDDEAALTAFAAAVDVVTFEFENIPVATTRFLAERVPLRPGVRSLEVAQDRMAEKQLLSDLGIGVATFAPVDAMTDVYSALAKTGRPAILKTRRLGYDGKGQALLKQGDDPSTAWRVIGQNPAILETLVPFEREISVILARAVDGQIRAFDIAENRHRRGMLNETTVPAAISRTIQDIALDHAKRIAEALDHVGVLAVEMFHLGGETPDQLLVNELAPRVHNSGHYTSDACLTSQFEQHIRAIVNWPLGDPARHSDVVMTNLIGESVSTWAEIATQPGASLHLYGKSETRAGRKMGHVNRITPLAGD